MQEKEREKLYIESDEEIPSVVTRLEKIKNKQVMLIVPKASILLQSVVNLKLLIRVAKKNSNQLGIISKDRTGRNLAAQVGIPVYDSISAKTPVLEPAGAAQERDEVIELDMSPQKKPPVKVHHFQEDRTLDKGGSTKEGEDSNSAAISPKGEDGQGEFDRSPGLSEGQGETERDVKKDKAVVLDKKRVYPKIRFEEGEAGRRKTKRKKFLILFILIFTVAALSVLIFAPKAKVNILVRGEDFEQQVNVKVDSSLKNASIEKALIPGKKFSSTKEKSEKFPATGTKNIGEKASGKITFKNGWSTEEYSLPAGTRLSKDGKIFVTTSEVKIPGASLTLEEGKVITNPGSVLGGVEASEPGEDYNVSAGKFAILDLPSDKRDKIYAESEKSLAGGSSKQVTVVSQSDIENAKEKLRSDLAKESLEEIKKEAQKKGYIVLDSASETKTQNASSSKEAGDEINEFNVKLTAKTVALGFREATYREVFVKNVEKRVPSDKQLVVNKDQVADITTTVEDFNSEEGTAVIVGTIKTKVGPVLDMTALKGRISGKKISEAKILINSEKEIESADIKVTPNWLLGRVPFSSGRIEVILEYK